MNEIHSLIDEVKTAELRLGALATKRAKASESASNASQAVAEIAEKIEKLSISEKTIGEAGQRLNAMANRALARGLQQFEVQDALQPLSLKAQIQAAMNLTIAAKDDAAKDSLVLQRLANEAQETLEAVETEFAEGEDTLESLRDDLRILQAQPA